MSQMSKEAIERARDLAESHVEQKECTCNDDSFSCAYRDAQHDFVRGYSAGMQDPDANADIIAERDSVIRSYLKHIKN